MGNELAAALRQFAERIERGEALPDASQCVLVLGDNSGNAQATYIGRYTPAQRAGIQLLGLGLLKLNAEQKMQREEMQQPGDDYHSWAKAKPIFGPRAGGAQ